MRFRSGWLAAAGLAAVLSLVGGPSRALAQGEGRGTTSEAELRERIKAEILAEMERKAAEEKRDREFQEMKQQLDTVTELLKQSQAERTRRDEAVQQASRTTSASTAATTTTVATGPVAGMKYQIPAQWAGTAPGYVVNYGGYNYLVGNDGTMTYYTGQVYDPNQQQTAGRTTVTDTPAGRVTLVDNGVTKSSSIVPYQTLYYVQPRQPATIYVDHPRVVVDDFGYRGGYGPRSRYLEQLGRIEQERTRQQEIQLGRDVAGGILNVISQGIR